MVGVSPLTVHVSQEISFDNLTNDTVIPNTASYRMSPLHETIWLDTSGGKQPVEFIKQKKESGDIGDVLRTYDRDGRSVLMYAIIKRQIITIKELVEAKIPLNYATDEVSVKKHFYTLKIYKN